MIIKVTQRDICLGIRGMSSSCPIARALNNQTGTNTNYVYNHEIIHMGIRCYCPRSVKRFVKSFDKGRPVKPFNFKLNKVGDYTDFLKHAYNIQAKETSATW